MKKAILKNLMILSFAFVGLFLVGNNVFAAPAVIMPPDDQGGGGNSATCYSTWNPPGLLGGGTWIWVCGLCDTQVKAKSFSDSGTCNF